MTTFENKTAIILGASAGVGRATAKALREKGARVIAVARRQDGLDALAAELPGVKTIRADGADPATAQGLLREHRPELLVLAGGNRPQMGPIDELSWESFSATWSSDVQSSFYFLQAALSLPLRAGSSVVLVSSGAAVNGSYLSGGYAGAKRMQWMLAGYAQQLSNQRQLGLRFLAVVPRQLLVGTEIGAVASSTYGRSLGISADEYMKRFETPLGASGVAGAILDGLVGKFGEATAIAVSGKGSEVLG